MLPPMSEGIALSAVARGTLLPEAQRLARLDEALPQIEAVLEGETDAVALQSTLAVGPYQGSMGCLRIDFARGVCGACARTATVQHIDDVHSFPGHIACDDRSRSELVLPVVARGELRAVLDLDSPHVAGFSAAEADRLLALLTRVFDRAEVVY